MEDQLKKLFEQIFGVDKVTYDTWDPKDDTIREQKCLFIEIQSARNGFRDKAEISRVVGSGMIVARYEQLPIGFFSKAIEQAPASLTKDLFFFDFETNNRRFRDIVVRGFSFEYFFRSQYDPATGSIESINISVEQE